MEAGGADIGNAGKTTFTTSTYLRPLRVSRPRKGVRIRQPGLYPGPMWLTIAVEAYFGLAEYEISLCSTLLLIGIRILHSLLTDFPYIPPFPLATSHQIPHDQRPRPTRSEQLQVPALTIGFITVATPQSVGDNMVLLCMWCHRVAWISCRKGTQQPRSHKYFPA